MKFVDMMSASPETLREHYKSCRELAHNNTRMAQHTSPNSWTRKKLARQMGYLMTQIGMMETVAKKRQFSLRPA